MYFASSQGEYYRFISDTPSELHVLSDLKVGMKYRHTHEKKSAFGIMIMKILHT